MPKMTLEELVHSHRPKAEEPAPKPKSPIHVSPITGEHLGYCKSCGVVSYCLLDEVCPVCRKSEGRAVGLIRDTMSHLADLVEWLESLGPQESWNVESSREPLHIKHSAAALMRTMKGMLDRETNNSG